VGIAREMPGVDGKQEEAFRMFASVGVVFLVVLQPEPTPDLSANKKLCRSYRETASERPITLILPSHSCQE
jgi:hypothetical protein